jgi:hypothetical protein
MSNQASRSTEYARELVRFQELQQGVLRHLMEVGPTKWDTMHFHFAHDRIGDVAHALRFLARWRYVTVDADGTVKITALGVTQLQRRSA